MKLNLFNSSIGRAVIIAQMIDLPKEALHSDGSHGLFFETYHNGREQGLCLQYRTTVGVQRKIVFSEDRRSDSIVVYSGEADEFNQGNTPSEVIYEMKSLFRDECEAANHINKLLSLAY